MGKRGKKHDDAKLAASEPLTGRTPVAPPRKHPLFLALAVICFLVWLGLLIWLAWATRR